MTAAKIYIVDEYEPVRLALAERLNSATNFQIIGHADNAEQVLREVKAQHPDVVLIEVKRSDGLGLEIVRQLAALPDAPRLVVLTSYPSEWERKAAIRAGARSYLLKDLDPEDLIRQISELCPG